jgi:4-diphosphocytidyl-2-C-methyl-D-erythritol kinase
MASPPGHASGFPSLQVSAPAKLNLTLEVVGKRPDRFHELRSLMVAIDLCDELTLTEEPNGALSFDCDVPELAGDDNLVMKAARLIREVTGCQRGAKIELKKRIPWAAGLGGGSSDAASTLAGLNELWQLNRTRDELATLGGQLGSDVSFFFFTPVAWCWSRGEKIRPLTLGGDLFFLLVAPREGLSTPKVFAELNCQTDWISQEEPEPPGELVKALREADVDRLAVQLRNDLQAAAMRISPAVRDWHQRLSETMAGRAMMSGSGSSWFALCRDREEAEQTLSRLQRGTPPDFWQTARIEIVRTSHELDVPLCWGEPST